MTNDLNMIKETMLGQILLTFGIADKIWYTETLESTVLLFAKKFKVLKLMNFIFFLLGYSIHHSEGIFIPSEDTARKIRNISR